MFDDLSSYGHMLLGIFAAYTNRLEIVTSAYMLYQIPEIESKDSKIGDILEYALGVGIGIYVKTK